MHWTEEWFDIGLGLVCWLGLAVVYWRMGASGRALRREKEQGKKD